MSAIFRINQDSVYGTWGVARQDMQLVGAGGTVTLEGQDQDTGDVYVWELISAPEGSTAEASLVVPDPVAAPWVATIDLDVTGGFIIRMRFNPGQPDEDISILYMGVPLAVSGLCIPAFNETYFDNSTYAVDGYAGYERKLTAFLKWVDTYIGSAGNDEKVKISATDTTEAFLETKVSGGAHVQTTVVDPTGNASIQFKLGDDATIWVEHGATAAANGANFKAAYNAAKLLTPGGAALSRLNRAVLVLPAGVYSLSAELALDTDFIDIRGVGAVGRHSVDEPLEQGQLPEAVITVSSSGPVLHITARDFQYTNLKVYQGYTQLAVHLDEPNGCDRGLFKGFGVEFFAVSYPAFATAGANTTIAATFIDCHSTGAIAGSLTVACDFAGRAERCTGGMYSFGGSSGGIGTFSGVALDCQTTGKSFGYGEGARGIFSGRAERCSGQNSSFGSSDSTSYGTITADGVLIDCVAEDYSYGSNFDGDNDNEIASGAQLLRCTGENNCFVGVLGTLSGTLSHCTALDNSFAGPDGLVGGAQLSDCDMEVNSFGGAASATELRRCRLKARTQAVPSFSGMMIDCEVEAAAGSGVAAVTAAASSRYYRCILLSNGGADTLTTKSPVTIGMAGCFLNRDISSDITNSIGDGRNVVSPNVMLALPA